MDLTIPGFGLMFITILCLAFFTLWIIAIIRVIKNEFPGQYEKLIWALLIIFLPFIGTIMYFFVGRQREIRN